MKIRLTKKLLASLPDALRVKIGDWSAAHSKRHISVSAATRFYIHEDARYTAYGPDMRSMTVRAGGEWAGFTDLMPGGEYPLPPGCTVVVTGFFQGLAWLTVHHNPAQAPAELASLTALVTGALDYPTE
jgi:hypothetical protein